jgi:hypothetical protein
LDPGTSVVTPTLVRVKTLRSSGAYTAPKHPQVSAHSKRRKKCYHCWSEARVSARRTRVVETLVLDHVTSVVTPTLVGAETLGSSGVYIAPKDPQVIAFGAKEKMLPSLVRS